MVILIDAAKPDQDYIHSQTYSYTRPLIQDENRLVEELLDTDFFMLDTRRILQNPCLPLEVGLTVLIN